MVCSAIHSLALKVVQPANSQHLGGFLHYFTEDWSDNARFVGTGWNNTEYRSYTFSQHQPEEAHLIETPESRSRRKQEEETNKDLSKEEDVNLKRTVSKEHEQLQAQPQQIPAKV